MQVLDRVREVETKRIMREQHAMQHQKLMLFYKQQKALENQARWEEKRTHVNNLKDIEEFKRGMMMADICMEDKQFEMWKLAKEQERRDQKEIARALAKRKEQIAQQLEKERLLKEEQNFRLASQLRNDDNCLAQLVEVMTPSEAKPRRGSRKPKQAESGSGQTREVKDQIREFKRSNKKQIRQLIERRPQSRRTRTGSPAAGRPRRQGKRARERRDRPAHRRNQIPNRADDQLHPRRREKSAQKIPQRVQQTKTKSLTVFKFPFLTILSTDSRQSTGQPARLAVLESCF